MSSVQDMQTGFTHEPRSAEQIAIQPAGYFLELSLDWIVRRASENIHRLLGQSHVTVIAEPLGRFVHSQALHDLRNLFSRLSGTTGIARAYAVRLTDERELVDIAFQLSDGRVLLEAVPSRPNYGEAFGTVGGLIAGLSGAAGQSLLENGARRMRALTGYDRVTFICGDMRAESSRGLFPGPASFGGDLPIIVADSEAEGIGIFPRDADESSAADALLRAPASDDLQFLAQSGTRALMRIPFDTYAGPGEFRCESRTPREPGFELHAAAELFAQLFAMRLDIARLNNS